MTVGVSFNGLCYANAAEGLLAFNQTYPKFDSNVVSSLLSSSVSGATLTYSLSIRMLDSNVINTRTGTVTLPACEVGGSVLSDHGVFLAAAFLIVWALGVNGGLKR